MKKYAFLVIALLILVAGCEQAVVETKGPEPMPVLKVEPVDLAGIETTKTDLTRFYKLDPINTELKVPEYELPLESSQISNYGDFNGKIKLDAATEGLLKKNGFAVIRNPFNQQGEDITQPYNTLKDKEVPIFITTDSLLHLYHIQFDETLRQIEEKEFYDAIWDISKILLNEAQKEYESNSGDIKEAAKRNIAYFSVALELLKPKEGQYCSYSSDELYNLHEKEKELYYKAEQCLVNREAMFSKEEIVKYHFDIPDLVKDVAEQELSLIDKHEGFGKSPIFTYREDYSQYVPRGHYTRSEKLKNYFKAMMWYGRISFLLKEGAVSEEIAKAQTISALLIAANFDKNKDLKEKWGRIYSVTAFYVGLSDDLGPYEYVEALNDAFDGKFYLDQLTQEKLNKTKIRLAEFQSPRIYGGTGQCSITPPFNVEQANQCLEDTKGFRLMGQRFIPDSYVMGELVSPHSGIFNGSGEPFTLVVTEFAPIRGFPRGLDVMALLGSARAKELLKEAGDSAYTNYSNKFQELETEFLQFDTVEWNKNLYWSWLYSLKALLKEYGTGYPTFMQTEAWQNKQLTTVLASWSELRHDTILYAKQSYTTTTTGAIAYIEDKPVVGYVEPVPEFYNRLLALTRMTTNGLENMSVIDDVSNSRLRNLQTILERLVNISKQELENKELSQEDYDFIKNFGKQLNGVIADVEDKAKKTSLIADVHTDQNSARVLEEGTGYVDLIVVAYKLPDERILIGAGPVMSYYEFKHPMGDRLTDEKWREMLQKGENPKRPEWTSNFIISP